MHIDLFQALQFKTIIMKKVIVFKMCFLVKLKAWNSRIPPLLLINPTFNLSQDTFVQIWRSEVT